ncbi:hypothetical protein [Nitrosarchaeum sp.]|uniref:hypothetical protein n=1 Tax=Nitrosarchaeum sp. TaxID=2026886 RepID=UPI00247CA15D|nr:hypothetical protein [Nitrosarchaeum sp.]MCV0412389.1 hypothetical protein [Nitrosarchaeum sp.]
MENSIYHCEHDDRKLRQSEDMHLEICDKCLDKFNDVKIRPIMLAKWFLVMTNEATSKITSGKGDSPYYQSLKLWASCNEKVIELIEKYQKGNKIVTKKRKIK